MGNRREYKTDIQYRTYVADNKVGRTIRTGRRSIQKRKHIGISVLLALVAAAAVISGLMLAEGFPSLAQSEPVVPDKYYKSITIKTGDTLWNIAEEYITDDYESIEEYISVLKDMNNLHGDKILSGDKLVVVYNTAL